MIYTKRFQAKHIPEWPVLKFLSSTKLPITRCDVIVSEDMPKKVALAKMRAMIKKGLVKEYNGYFELTELGKAVIENGTT